MADTTGSGPDADCLEKLKSFIKTQEGFILTAEIVLSLVIVICFASSLYGFIYAHIITGPTIELCCALVVFIVFLMGLDKQIHLVNWVWSDLLRSASGTLVCIITFIIFITRRVFWDSAFITGGVFCVFAGILFAYDTYTICLQIQRNMQHSTALTENRPPCVQEAEEIDSVRTVESK